MGGPPAAAGPPRPFSSAVPTCIAMGAGPKSLTELAMPVGNHRFV